MLLNRELMIVKYLYNNQKKYSTSWEIGKEVGYSEKTVRQSIRDICEKVSKDIFSIISKRGKGFYIEIYNTEKYFELLDNSTDFLKNNNINLSDKQGREKFILQKILLEGLSLHSNEIKEMLYISDSTLQKDIYEVKEKLYDYNLEMLKDKCDRYYIKGKELDKRHFILDYFFSDRYNNSFISQLEDINLFDKNTVSQLLIILLDEIREYHILVNDYIIQNLVLHFALLIERVKSGCIIDENVIKNEDFDAINIGFVKSVSDRISKSFNIELPNEERKYISMQLCAKTKSDYLVSNTASINEKDLIAVLENLSIELNINLVQDSLLINGLKAHLYSLVNRVESGLYISNPLLDQITTKYKSYFVLIKNNFKNLPIFRNTAVPDDEWAYIVIYILSAIERNKINKKANVLLVCASGFSSGQMLKSRVENEFSNFINIKGVLGYYELVPEKLKEIDFIISTIDLAGLVIPTPFVKSSVFLDEKDCENINNIMQNIKMDDQKNCNSREIDDTKRKENEEIFDRYFSIDNFFVDLGGSDKNKILNIIFSRLATDEEERKKYVEETKLREEFGTVVFNKHIAMPHPIHPIKTYGEVFVYKSSSNIGWSDHEGEVKLVFYISPPRVVNREYEKIILMFTKLLKQEEIILKLINSDDYCEFRAILINLM